MADTVEDYLKEQKAEWDVYVATQPIDVNGARAFNPGDAVPASHVDRGVVSKDAVARKDTKAAKAATEES